MVYLNERYINRPPIPKEELEYINEELAYLSDEVLYANAGYYTSIIRASDWISEDFNNESLRNQWKMSKYSAITGSASVAPTLDQCISRTPTSEFYQSDSTLSAGLDLGENYSMKCSTWVYFPEDYSTTITITSDDAHNSYLNGVKVGGSTNTSGIATIFNFKKGWNNVVVCYEEKTGGDGFTTSPKLSAIAEKMCAEQLQGYSNTFTVELHTGYLQDIDISTPGLTILPMINMNLTLELLFFSMEVDEASYNEEKRNLIYDLLNSSITATGEDTITVSNVRRCPSQDILISWIVRRMR